MNPIQLAAYIAAGRASDEQMATAGMEFVFGVKSDDKLAQTRMHAAPAILRGADDDTRTLSWIASTESVDRMGDIIRVRGWDLKQYRKNPIILFQHNADWPIGTAKVKKGEVAGGGKGLFADVTFASAEASELAEQVYQLAKAKVLRGNSVGFIPRQVRRPESDEERQELGLGAYGVVFEKAELIEDSIVSVPANPDAIQLGWDDPETVRLGLRSCVSVGTLTQDQADAFAHEVMKAQPSDWFDNARRSLIDFSGVGDQLRSILDAESDEEDDAEQAARAAEEEATRSSSGNDDPTDEGSGDVTVEGLIETLASSEDLGDDNFEDQVRHIIDVALQASRAADVPSEPMPALMLALSALMATQTEQLAATRQLADTLNDLARKVLDLNAVTPKQVDAGDEPGDEEIDPETLRSLSELLTKFGKSLPPK